MRRIFLVFGLLFVPISAWAQQPVTSYPAAWAPVGNTITLSPTTSSVSAQMGWVATSANPAPSVAYVCNTGSDNAYVKIGESPLTASSNDTPVLAGACQAMAVQGYPYVAAVAATSSTTIKVQNGNGWPMAGGTGSGGGTGTFMFTAAGNAILPTARHNLGLGVVSVLDCGATGDGTDQTAQIQECAARVPSGGGKLYFPAGNYVIHDLTTLVSGTHVTGEGAGSVITAADQAAWPDSNVGTAFKGVGGSNYEVSGLRFAWPHGNFGFAHILSFDGATNVSVHDNQSDGGGDFVAYIGSTNVITYGNTATNMFNSGCDHWNGGGYARCIGNYFSMVSSSPAGTAPVQFTGINSDGTPATITDFAAIGNTLYIDSAAASAGGIFFNAHPDGGGDNRGLILGNKVIVNSSFAVQGIVVNGHANNVIVADNYCEGGNTNGGEYPCVSVQSPATGVIVHDNLAYNWQAGSAGVFVNAGAGGSLHDNHALSSSTLLGSNSSTVTVYGNDTGTGTINLSKVNITSGAAVFDGSISGVYAAKWGWDGGGSNLETFNTGAGQFRGIMGQTAGVNRLDVLLGDGTAEGGSNQGSNYQVQAFDDAGSFLGTVEKIYRASAHKQLGGIGTTTVANGSGDCGTSPSIAGNDNIGRITVGSSTNGGKCTVTFAKTWEDNAPVCFVDDETTSSALRPEPTTTTLTINGTLTAGDKLVYRCAQY